MSWILVVLNAHVEHFLDRDTIIIKVWSSHLLLDSLEKKKKKKKKSNGKPVDQDLHAVYNK